MFSLRRVLKCQQSSPVPAKVLSVRLAPFGPRASQFTDYFSFGFRLSLGPCLADRVGTERPLPFQEVKPFQALTEKNEKDPETT